MVDAGCLIGVTTRLASATPGNRADFVGLTPLEGTFGPGARPVGAAPGEPADRGDDVWRRKTGDEANSSRLAHGLHRL